MFRTNQRNAGFAPLIMTMMIHDYDEYDYDDDEEDGDDCDDVDDDDVEPEYNNSVN